MNMRIALCSFHRGLTLIEVMVAVALITLLAAVLVVSLSRARQQSRTALCRSNVYQLTKAFHMLLEESKGVFPRAVNMQHNFGGRQGSGSLAYGNNIKKPVPKPLNPYLKLPRVTRTGAEVFACPCDRGVGIARPTAFIFYGNSYRTNELLVGQNQIDPPASDPCEKSIQLWTQVNGRIKDVRRSSLDNESRLILLGDAPWYWNYDRAQPDNFTAWHFTPRRHILGFMDGHADFVEIRKGVHTSTAYTVVPFRDIADLAARCGKEIPGS